MNNKPMATRATQKELAYMAYWQKPENGGHVFRRGDVIPKSTTAWPGSRPRKKELFWTALVVLSLSALAYFDCASKGLF